MIESVQAQTYSDWELCLADGSDAAHPQVERIVMQFQQRDNRIKYRKLEKNFGISGNTNACIEMATGDYIALFDHDDLLHPSVLYENMKAICEQGADFIYTDELTFQGTTKISRLLILSLILLLIICGQTITFAILPCFKSPCWTKPACFEANATAARILTWYCA